MENYIVINGKKAELTKEQLEILGITSTSSPFGARTKDRHAFYINEYGGIGATDAKCNTAARMDEIANVFNDCGYASQVAMHQNLYRQLLKFRSEIEDEGDKYPLFFITYSADCRIAPIYHPDEAKHFGEVYFNNPENAMRAVKEIVRPFLKAHPNFKWTM